mgnify:CR=1 FL=1
MRGVRHAYAGEAASAEVCDTKAFATVANASEAITSGFLTFTKPPSPNTAAGGPPAIETIAVNTSQIKSIAQL